MGLEKLEDAKVKRERWEQVQNVFREVLDRAIRSMTRSDMIRLTKSLPDIAPEHVEYIRTAPYPDYISGFGDILSLYMKLST